MLDLIRKDDLHKIMAIRPPDYVIRNTEEGDMGPVVFSSWIIYKDGEDQQIELHRFMSPDPADCFHTHPAYAMRLCVQGGYVEELATGEKRTIRPGYFGEVSPHMAHRVHRLLNGVSISLWFRGPRVGPVMLLGPGWGDREGELIE